MDAVALLGRVMLGAIFVWAGYGKLMDPAGTAAMLGKTGLPMPDIAYWVAVVVELGGGTLFILGVKARYVALLLAIWCIATALIAHSDFADRGQLINFFKNVAMAGGFLQVVAVGGGRLAVTRD